MSKPLYLPSEATRQTGLRRDVEILKRRALIPSGIGPYPVHVQWNMFGMAAQRKAVHWFHVEVDPAASVPYKAVVNNYHENVYTASTNFTAADADYFIIGARLGPKGSNWAFSISYLRGPDFGKIYLDAATAIENLDGTVTDIGTVTWVNIAGNQDGYLAAAGIGGNNGAWPFFMDGEDGAQLTTWNNVTTHADGGAGIWLFKIRINGKNAASTGFKGAIFELGIVRYDTTGFQPLA
jgi:hypothetical protein